MLAPLHVEFVKLKRSLALVVALLAPGLIALFTFFNALRMKTPGSWDVWLTSSAGIWAFFMLPMSVTALTALVAHMEHGPRTWDHLRALPVPRWRLYAAKAVGVLALVALMSVAVPTLSWAALQAGSAIQPGIRPTGVVDWGHQAGVLGRMYLAALMLIAIQLWVALRFHSFVPALSVGIGGTFFAVVATSAKQGVFLPWQMPVNMLASEPWRVQTALGLGCVGGLAVLVLMLVSLSRREVR
ncbi:MAG: ABC transporter permease [Brevundimonas sp.]|uniref:ABC transporter permease n=1 Tax=Brevundimonas sp. TaxID=1871086 RepID=UPI0025BCE97A|nr:ABC transporter permease [Brevundimonas sp.]MBX3477654.1 ABC transporter permease [Brevundimonas sp.]